MSPRRFARLLPAAVIAALLATAMFGCAARWPRGSNEPVTPLDHPTIETILASRGEEADADFRFVVFGDQRAQDTWPELMSHVAALPSDRAPLFMLDTGDIVDDGKHTDQFARLREILSPCASLPYLVAVGNHEISYEEPGGRDNAARFLAYLDPAFGAERLYYRKVVGPLRFLFLDSTDLVHLALGDGDGPEDAPTRRARAQLDWLAGELDAHGPWRATVVAIHHPFLQSSSINRGQAQALWSLPVRGRPLPDLLADAGVDLLICGHTHTTERFLLTRADGASLRLFNVSGKPHGFFGAGRRRAHDLRGREDAWFAEQGWEGTRGWSIVQEGAMVADEANQFVVVDVDGEGGMTAEIFFLDPDFPEGLRSEPAFRLR